MDDNFLHGLRRDPSPEFARRLKTRLDELDAHARTRRFSPRAARWTALAASLALVAFAFTLPIVRAGAQAFLDLFRVTNFAGVAFDPQRLSEIGAAGLDLPKMVGEQIEVLTGPQAPVSYATPQEAGAAAGIRVYAPAWLPDGMRLADTEVVGETALRFTLSTANLQTVLDALGIDDVTVPVGIDGEQASLRVPPVVKMTYESGPLGATLLQARSPDVSFPAGLDLSVLAEIGLRILGLSRNEAYRFAQSVDWRTTLLVPVPTTAASFRQLDVQGEPALVVESSGRVNGRAGENVVLWSHQNVVYALRGSVRVQELLEMAQTLQ